MKKKILLLFILSLMFIPNALAVNIKGCETVLPGVMIDVSIANIVHSFITVVKIIVPVLLVIFGMIDLIKGLTSSKEDEIKKGQKTFIKRVVAAVIVFFIVSLVQLLISFVAGSDTNLWSCINCFLDGANTSSGVCGG